MGGRGRRKKDKKRPVELCWDGEGTQGLLLSHPSSYLTRLLQRLK